MIIMVQKTYKIIENIKRKNYESIKKITILIIISVLSSQLNCLISTKSQSTSN